MRATLAAALVFVIAACAGAPVLKPAPDAMRLTGHDYSALGSDHGVQVFVDTGAWKGSPRELPGLNAIRVTILNDSRQPLAIRYNEFSLQGPTGARMAALPPIPLGGAFGGSGQGQPYPPKFEHQKFLLAPAEEPYYRDLAVWPGPFTFDPLYYDTNYRDWPIQPTDQMIEQAMPEGVLQAGGVLSGFLFFREMPRGIEGLRFSQALVSAEGGRPFGHVEIPLTTK